jgi:hypothetical protein
MTGDESRDFDALSKLTDQAWREWDHKSRAEWRLTFGIWGALLAAAAAVSKAEVQLPWLVGAIMGFIVLVVHWRWLFWMRKVLNYYRSAMEHAVTRMCALAILPEVEKERRHKTKALWHPSIQTQLIITLILVLILVLVSLSRNNSLDRGQPPDLEASHTLLLQSCSGPPVQAPRSAVRPPKIPRHDSTSTGAHCPTSVQRPDSSQRERSSDPLGKPN